MRSAIFIILTIVVFLTIAQSCGNRRSRENKVAEQNNPIEKKEPGKIVFNKEIHNFGTLKDGEIVSFSFVFRNTGGRAFQITKAEKSCGCIEIKYDTQPVSPGDSSFIELVFNTAGEWGNQLKGATIETSEGERKELQIGAYIENKQFNNLINTQK